jgi:hypothetical protein
LDVLNEEYKAELAEYDTQMTEAWRIQNKYYGNPAEEDSDSGLSALSSRLFNGMEGIEMGGVSNVRNNEIGGMAGIGMGGDSKVQGNQVVIVLYLLVIVR